MSIESISIETILTDDFENFKGILFHCDQIMIEIIEFKNDAFNRQGENGIL